MAVHTYIIKSLYVQNAIMLLALGAVLFLLARAVIKGKAKHIIVFSIWVCIVLWFFNSPFFGFSAATLGPQGIKLHYGIISFRDVLVPVESQWSIESRLSGIRKTKRVYFIRIGDRESMKVRWKKGHELLKDIGEAIDAAREGQGEREASKRSK
jgi:uncharacterized membrane-anchored protein YitT (DUF2179 family)